MRWQRFKNVVRQFFGYPRVPIHYQLPCETGKMGLFGQDGG